MDIFSFDVNWVAVIGVAVLSMVVGFAWYSTALFGKTWMKLAGIKKDQLGGDPTMYLYTFVGSLVAAFVLANLIRGFGVVDALDGAVVGIMTGLVVLSAMLSTYLFEQKPLKLLLIDGLYHITYLALAGALLTVWV